VTLTVADGGEDNAQPDTELFTISVTAVNDAPVFTSTAVTTATEDILYQYDANASDEDGDSLTFSLSSAPSGMTIDAQTGLIEWTPLEGVTSGNVEVTVSDGTEQVTQSYAITVTAVNDSPTITSTEITTATEDQAYQYQVTASDPENDTLTFTLSDSPDGMTLSDTGLIDWTPLNGVSSGLVTVEVSDGEFTVSQSFTIAVTAVNDPVSVADPGAQSLLELSAWQVQLSVSDVDDDNNGSDITFSLQSAPAGLTVSSTGLLSWTPGQDTSGSYTLIVSVADGLEDGATAAQVSIALSVAMLDADQDNVADYHDNCVNDANTDQLDTDQDTLGNVCDSDDDGDGIPDTVETAYQLDPLDASDALLDLDGDSLNNLDEYLACLAQLDTECATLARDSVAPVISFTTPITVDATGYLTPVTLTATAQDALDGALVPFIVGGTTSFRPGVHQVQWQARDQAGNTATAEQEVRVRPRVVFGGTKVSGEGKTLSIPVTLSGAAISYPVTVAFSVAGSASAEDYQFTSLEAVITEGTAGSLTVAIQTDQAIEGDETIDVSVVSVSDAAIVGEVSTYQVLIVDRNIAPELELAAQQNGVVTNQVFQDGGTVTLSALGSDANDDELTLTWELSEINSALLTEEAQSADIQQTQQFDPQQLTAGQVYQVAATVSDGVLTSRATVALLVQAAQPTLSAGTDSDGDGIDDLSEGLTDTDGDGVPDYQDAVNDSTRLSAARSGAETRSLMTAEAGLRMSVGRTALGKGQGGALVRSQDMTDDEGNVVRDGNFSVVGGLYDFVVKGLTEAKRTARIVIPLTQSVPTNASYRKFANGEWFEFVETSTDFIESANSEDGNCPAPGSSNYQAGLLRFADCLQLNISDGGPNDADGEVNGVIVDPSGVAGVAASSTGSSLSAPDDQPSGSGGSLGIWAILALLALLIKQGWHCHRRISQRFAISTQQGVRD
jgi:hypothetical protein